MRQREGNHRIDRNAPRKRAALAAPLLLLAALTVADSCRDEIVSVLAQSKTGDRPDGGRHCAVAKKPDSKKPKTAGAYWDKIGEINAGLALDLLRIEAIGLEAVGRDKDAEEFRKAHLDRSEPSGEVIVVIDGVRYHVLSLKDKGQVFLFTTDGDPSKGKCLLIDGISATLPLETCRPGDVENTQPPISPNPDGETYTA